MAVTKVHESNVIFLHLLPQQKKISSAKPYRKVKISISITEQTSNVHPKVIRHTLKSKTNVHFSKGKVQPIELYEEANLPTQVLSNIRRAHFEEPTPIQRYTIPCIRQQDDLVACAQTGSGKTVKSFSRIFVISICLFSRRLFFSRSSRIYSSITPMNYLKNFSHLLHFVLSFHQHVNSHFKPNVKHENSRSIRRLFLVKSLLIKTKDKHDLNSRLGYWRSRLVCRIRSSQRRLSYSLSNHRSSHGYGRKRTSFVETSQILRARRSRSVIPFIFFSFVG